MSKLLEDKRKHEQTLNFYLQCDSRDVQFTLKKYAKEEEDDINISKFYNEKV